MPMKLVMSEKADERASKGPPERRLVTAPEELVMERVSAPAKTPASYMREEMYGEERFGMDKES